MVPFVSEHGRQPGRGARPWLLIPKILSLAALLGGLVTVAVLLHTAPLDSQPDWQHLTEMTSMVPRFVIIPAVIATLLFGILLLSQHPRVFLRKRWMQVKLALLLVSLPALHLTARWLLGRIHSELVQSGSDGPRGLMTAFVATVDVAIGIVVLTIILGRLKPRIGQRTKTIHQQRR